MDVPTLYEMQPIGANGDPEAVAALYFCSEKCRVDYRAAIQDAEASYSWAEEPWEDCSFADGHVCDQCETPLRASRAAR